MFSQGAGDSFSGMGSCCGASLGIRSHCGSWPGVGSRCRVCHCTLPLWPHLRLHGHSSKHTLQDPVASSKPGAVGKPESREGQCLKIPNLVWSQLCPFPTGTREFSDPHTSPTPSPQNSSISAACAGILVDIFCFSAISWNFAFLSLKNWHELY